MRPASLIILSIFLLAACKHKDDVCTEKVYRIPSSIIFYKVPLTASDTLIIKSLDPTTHTLIKADTISLDSLWVSNDTSFFTSGRLGFSSLTEHTDYEVAIKKSTEHWNLSNLHYSGDSVITWTEKGCRSRGFVSPASSIAIDGEQTPLAYLGTNRFYVVLQ